MRTNAIVATLAVPGAVSAAHAQQLLSIEIVGPGTVIELTETQYTCIAHFDKGDLDVTEQTEWSVEPDNQLISMDGGLLTVGDLTEDIDVTITATYEVLDVKKTTTFMVLANAPDIVSLTVSGPTEIGHESETQYQCTATLEYGDDVDVTDTAVWSVEPGDAAMIDGGLLTVGTLFTETQLTVSAEVATGKKPVVDTLQVLVLPLAVVYDNEYDGMSTFGLAGQIYEDEFSGYDIWLGDDFSSNSELGSISIASTEFCGNGCIDPFDVQGFYAMLWDELPNDPGANLIAESDSSEYDGGTGVRTAFFKNDSVPAGQYFFAFASRNDFGTNGQTFFYEQTIGDGQDDGWQWNPNGAFGFADNLQFVESQDGEPTSPNAVIKSSMTCPADCNLDGQLNVLDFVCFQQLWLSGDEAADCDENGVLNLLDFVCYQAEYLGGC